MKIINRIFGTRNERLLNTYRVKVAEINKLKNTYKQLSDADILINACYLKKSIKNGSDKLRQIESFALAIEAIERVAGIRLYDEQILGGIALLDQKIIEMKTGEGKTLTAVLPVFYKSLYEHSIHVVTVNDYLAKRDANKVREILELLGVSTGFIYSGMPFDDRKSAYLRDVTYGSSSEFGFDYLRDNRVYVLSDKVQNGHAFAILDEIDSILIDEATMPLIISGLTDSKSDIYNQLKSLFLTFTNDKEGDFYISNNAVEITDGGYSKIENILINRRIISGNLYSIKNIDILYCVNATLLANFVYKKDVHYLVKEGKVVAINEFTGRSDPDKRWMDGVHEALEAKEGVDIQSESKILASLTYQNYFNLYTSIGGMTGTADTDSREFFDNYDLEVVVIDTHLPMIRTDASDLFFMTKEKKHEVIVEDIINRNKKGQPILVNTVDIGECETISRLLEKKYIHHEVINAKQSEYEVEVIAKAGKLNAITISSLMAGRGTDIILGGDLDSILLSSPPFEWQSERESWRINNKSVKRLSGLHVINASRSNQRRVDNQVIGRSGRQGDPGSSQCYISMEDNLINNIPRDSKSYDNLKLTLNDPSQFKKISKIILDIQKEIEIKNQLSRKELLAYDSNINEQRLIIYKYRDSILGLNDSLIKVTKMRLEVAKKIINDFIGDNDRNKLIDTLTDIFKINLNLNSEEIPEKDDLEELIFCLTNELYIKKTKEMTNNDRLNFEKAVMIKVLDNLWHDHLFKLNQLRKGVFFRCYAQLNPIDEFKKESFKMFDELLRQVNIDVTRIIFSS